MSKNQYALIRQFPVSTNMIRMDMCIHKKTDLTIRKLPDFCY